MNCKNICDRGQVRTLARGSFAQSSPPARLWPGTGRQAATQRNLTVTAQDLTVRDCEAVSALPRINQFLDPERQPLW
jgi:hypothetical protein